MGAGAKSYLGARLTLAALRLAIAVLRWARKAPPQPVADAPAEGDPGE